MTTETHCGVELTCEKDGSDHKICRSGKKLTIEQAAAAVIEAGFSAEKTILVDGYGLHSKAAVMVAIGMDESGLDPYIIGETISTGTQYVGWLQIADVHAMGCDRMHPQKAADKAFLISAAGMTFHPWESYTNGDYKANLGAAETAVQSDPDKIANWDDLLRELRDTGLPGAGGLADIWDKTNTVKEMLEAIFDFLKFFVDPENWLRLGLAVFGAIILGLGIYYLQKES